MVKRLFLFAGYDKDGIIDDTLIWYLDALSKLGEIVLIMDCDVKDTSKLKNVKNILHVETKRHGEYDFGSYKRGFMWAHKNKLFDEYDWVYFVNDSVYGPLFNLKIRLLDLESRKVDLTGMADFFDKTAPKHIQSWFIGVSKKAVKSEVLYDFMKNIKHHDSKLDIIFSYEIHFSQMFLQNGFSMSALLNQNGYESCIVYEEPKKALEKFVPFLKKSALKETDRRMLLAFTSEDFISMIYKNAERTGIDFNQNEKILKSEKIYRFSLLSIPIYSVFYKIINGEKNYKIYLFDKVPVIKIVKRNRKTEKL